MQSHTAVTINNSDVNNMEDYTKEKKILRKYFHGLTDEQFSEDVSKWPLNNVLEAIREAAKQKWISVEEDVPSINEPIYDKNGREIKVGDTLKIFHFVGARRKKYYMYKYVHSVVLLSGGKSAYLKVKHLSPEDKHYHIALNGKKHQDIEIVQGYGDDGDSYENRPKVV